MMEMKMWIFSSSFIGSAIAIIGIIRIRKQRQREQENSRSTILWITEVGTKDVDLVGGKGANLGELVKALGNDYVPAGFCLTSKAYETYRLSSSSGKTCNILPFREELLAAYQRLLHLGKKNTKNQHISLAPKVVVRSSATVEDSQDASFAGQLETFLGITNEEDFLDAIQKCYDSTSGERIAKYASTMTGSFAAKDIIVCIVVQLMVEADCAGVMFTANPQTKRLEETVISANWGVGESVVADLCIPDTWVLESKDGTLISQTISNSKTVMIDGNGLQVPVPENKQKRASLTRNQLLELTKIGQRIQKHYKGSPQDIEWAIKDGNIFLLQTRPITTLDRSPAPTIHEFDGPCRDTDWITTCNASEMFPGAMTPLTMSTFGRMADEGIQRMQMMFGVRSRISKTAPLVSTYSGHLHLNLTNVIGAMCVGMIGGSLAKENGEMSILGKINEQETLEHLVESAGGYQFILKRLFNGLRYAVTMFLAHYRIPRMKARIDKPKHFEQSSTSRELFEKLDLFMKDFDDQWTDGLVCSTTSAAFMLGTMKLLAPRNENPWSSKNVSELAMLLGQDSNTIAESALAVKELDELQEEAYDIVKEKTLEEATEYLMKTSDSVGQRFRLILERHGHRAVNEVEMRAKDWSEDPSMLVRSLMVPRSSSNQKLNESLIASGENLIITQKTHLNLFTRAMLRFFVNKTRKAVQLRELAKSLQVKITSQLKKGYRRLANLLVKEKHLSEHDLLYFLTHNEIGILCRSPESQAAKKLNIRAIQRRRIFEIQKKLSFPMLSQGTPIAISNESSTHESLQQQGNITLMGVPVSSGVASGYIRVILSIDEAHHLREGEILICRQTDVAWSPYFSIASALITEIGGLLSHGAVVAREYGLPCLVSVQNATKLLKTGQFAHIDADKGTVTVII